jgi:hypothetical protein
VPCAERRLYPMRRSASNLANRPLTV